MNNSSTFSIDKSLKAYTHLKNLISYEQEEVWVICLTSSKSIICSKKIFMGSLNFCPIHPRDILRFVILNNSHSYIICHSHPSGDPTPSFQDHQMTTELQKASQILRIEMEDHIIYSKNSYFSFKDHSLI